jgi:apolipoprotein N-acyltransferase
MLRIVLPAFSGSLLFLSDYPAHLWPLQLFAFLFWIGSLDSGPKKEGFRSAWLVPLGAGAILGVFYAAPLLVVTAFPWMMAIGLGIYTVFGWMVASWIAYRVNRWPGLHGAFAVGAVVALVEWIATHAIPIWGTAQSFVRVWSESPWAIQFVDITGGTGIVFVLVSAQAVVVRLLRKTLSPRRGLTSLAVMFGLITLYNAARWFEPPISHLRVAAIGWVDDDMPLGARTPSPQVVETMVIPLVRKAVDQGAALVVCPEAPFMTTTQTRDLLLEPLFMLAQQRDVALAIGYFDRTHDDNRVVLIDRKGAHPIEYRKTHRVPFIERYQAGDGTRVDWQVRGNAVGAMICQDDNFEDLASGYGRDRRSIVLVPTNDWHAVKDYHYENSRMRPIENRYGVIRAATNGISAVLSARGQVLAASDHFADGAGVVMADLPIYRSSSCFAWARYAFPICCLAFLLWMARRNHNWRNEG